MSKRERYMRLIVFFDLPTDTPAQRREYAKFRKYLLKNGYLMMQESVYSKLAVDGRMVDTLINRLKQNKPPAGLVQALQVTEKQFANMVYVAGRYEDNGVVDDTDTLVVL